MVMYGNGFGPHEYESMSVREYWTCNLAAIRYQARMQSSVVVDFELQQYLLLDKLKLRFIFLYI